MVKSSRSYDGWNMLEPMGLITGGYGRAGIRPSPLRSKHKAEGKVWQCRPTFVDFYIYLLNFVNLTKIRPGRPGLNAGCGAHAGLSNQHEQPTA